MGYLTPPPAPAAVIVMKDVGGLVSQYKAQTDLYRREGREVRLHECRSACTLALSLPNVCVYPHSVLRFHQAYNRDTKVVDQGVSDELFQSYPPAVRAKLGYLTRQYRSLTGAELIDLGVRNCNEDRTLIARRNAPKKDVQMAANAPAGESGVGSFFSNLYGKIAGQPAPPTPARPAPAPSPQKTITLRATPLPTAPADIPTPPPRPPLDIAPTATIPPPADAPGAVDTPAVVEVAPLPPRRPADLTPDQGAPATATTRAIARAPASGGYASVAPKLPRLITGAYPVLPQGLNAYAPLRVTPQPLP